MLFLLLFFSVWFSIGLSFDQIFSGKELHEKTVSFLLSRKAPLRKKKCIFFFFARGTVLLPGRHGHASRKRIKHFFYFHERHSFASVRCTILLPRASRKWKKHISFLLRALDLLPREERPCLSKMKKSAFFFFCEKHGCASQKRLSERKKTPAPRCSFFWKKSSSKHIDM